MDKKGQKGMSAGMIILLVAVGYVLFFGVPDLGGLGGTAETDDTNQGTTAACPVEDSSVTFNLVNRDVQGTTVGDRVFVLTDNQGAVAVSTATNFAANKDIEAMYGENSTTYYTKVETFNTDCQGVITKTVGLAQADTDVNDYIENSNGQVNSGTDAQAVDANDVVDVSLVYKAGTNTYFGNPDSTCNNIGIVEYDKTYFKSITGDTAASVPGVFTYHNSTYDGSNAFVIPKSANGEKIDINLQIESTASDPPSTAAMPIVHIWDCDIDKDEDTLALIHGVEDEDNNNITLAAQTQFLYTS